VISILSAPALQAGASGHGEGKRLYLAYCAGCHGSDGKGAGRASARLAEKPADLTKEGLLVRMSDHQLRRLITGGGRGFHGSRYLPGMKVDFTTEQVYELIGYLRSLQPLGEGDPVEGRKLYVAYCAPCHGRGGKGDGEKAPYLDAKPKDQSDDRYMSKKTDQELYRAIRYGGGAVHGAKFMPQWQQTLRPREIWDLVSYIRTLHRSRSRQGDPRRGGELFAVYCASCHGERGEGDGPMADILTPQPKGLSSASLDTSVTEQDLYFTILGGGRAMNLSEQMPAWGDVLSEKDVWDLIAYIRSLR